MIDHAPKSSSVPVAPFATRQAKNLGTDPTGVGRRPLLAFSLPTEPASPASPAQPFIQEESLLHMGSAACCCPRCIHGLAHAGRIGLLPTAWIPPLPPLRLIRSHCCSFQLSQPFGRARLVDWRGKSSSPLPPRRVQYRDWVQIPGLRGRDEDGRTYRIYCSVVTCVMMMMIMVERTPTRPREKETPASFGTPASTRTHTIIAMRQSVRHLPIAEPA